jgi:hypothetical protein
METNQTDNKDNQLWYQAKKRAGFKWSLLSYLLVNTFLTGVWLFGGQGHFWPAWCMLGWGFGLVMQYFNAYHRTGMFSIEKEYEKLKNESNS